MDYEKKYTHALEVVRELQKDWASSQNRAAREIELAFPELRESEDETTRKELLDFVISFWADHKEKLPQTSRWVTYLEKQKEQKPAEWSEGDEKKIHFLSRLIEFQVKDGEYCFGEGSCAISKQEAIEMLQSLRPQSQKLEDWTEEDEKVYNNALDALYYKYLNNKDDVLSALKDLCDLISKKRKVIPQYSRWKPSDEQIKALGAAIVFHKNDPHIDMWRSLYDDLQKIR